MLLWYIPQLLLTVPSLRLITESGTLSLLLRALVPNRMATKPIKNPVVTAYLNIASAITHTPDANNYALLILYNDIILKYYWNVSSKSLSAPIA